jgi:23S rRNA A1618 N6-methylase RlmF
VTTDAIAAAVDAACRVRDADGMKAFKGAVRHFRHVLSAMPDESLGPVSPGGARRLQALADGVIECIEQRTAATARGLDAQALAEDIYRIRALLEDVDRVRHHGYWRSA